MSMSSDSLVVAVATVDGYGMPNEHFGEAPRFDLYRVGAATVAGIRSIKNQHAQEGHGGRGNQTPGRAEGDNRKGTDIGRLLESEGVQVMVSPAFGPNVRQMRRRFLPVVVRCGNVPQAIALLQTHWSLVWQYWMLGEERRHLVLPHKTEKPAG